MEWHLKVRKLNYTLLFSKYYIYCQKLNNKELNFNEFKQGLNELLIPLWFLSSLWTKCCHICYVVVVVVVVSFFFLFFFLCECVLFFGVCSVDILVLNIVNMVGIVSK